MKISKIYPLVFLMLAGLSCEKKKYPESITENEAEYYSNMEAGGSQVSLRAGVNEYYMFSTIAQDSDKVNMLLSDMKPASCNGVCPNSLQIQFNDYKTSVPGEAVIIDSILKLKRYEFLYSGSSQAFQVDFTSSYNRTAASTNYNWDFGDGSTYNGTTPVHMYKKPGNYQVCLTVKGSNNCISSSCNLQTLSSSRFYTSVSALANGDTLTFTHHTSGGKAPYTFQWNFGDGKTSALENPTHPYKYPGSYQVSLKVKDANGLTILSNYNAVTKTEFSSCAANYRINSIVPVEGSSGWNKVAVRWADASGVLYSSSLTEQPSSSFFEVISISEGPVNEKGQATKKVQVRFTCKVFNGVSTIDIKNAEATIAVAYK